MFLSRIQLQDSIRDDSRLGIMLKNKSYAIHQLLYDLFENKSRFLFREESTKEQLGHPRNTPVYYVLSEEAPLQNTIIFDVNTKSFEPKLKIGDQLGFRLRANPTVAKPVAGKKNSKRHDVIMNAQREWLIHACEERGLPSEGQKSDLKKVLLDHPDYKQEGVQKIQSSLHNQMQHAAKQWLLKKSEKNGFTIQSSQLQATGYRWNALPEKGRNAGFSSMDYEGVMTVVKPDQLVQLLKQGVGPAKAFGCGLMLIRRL